MRLALQALFAAIEANEEGAARRALLERRLRASERSVGFFRRLRAVVDDETLRAPEVFAEESFPDANVVAEYLDAQTESNLARDYEDACFDSPEILAEVGRCYDILNNDALNCVVVPKNCRRRLYYVAWEEENVVNIAQGTEEDSVLTADSTTLTSEETSEVETPEITQTEKSAEEPVARDVPKAKKRKENAKSAKTVGAALAAERSWGRRLKRLCVRAALILAIVAAGRYGWRNLNDSERSETLQIHAPTQELVESNGIGQPIENEEVPLRPTTISSANLGEILPPSSSEVVQAGENDALVGVAGLSNEVQEAPKLAILPNGATDVDDNLGKTTTKTQKRIGLGGEEHWNRRPPIEIPAQNNDVFTKSKLY